MSKPKTAKKRIFFLSDNFPPERNAAASRVYERGLYWIRDGHNFDVLTCFPNFPEGKIYPGYQNKWFGKENLSGTQVYRVKSFIAANKGFGLRVLDFLSYMVTSFVAGIFLIKKDHDVIISTSPQFFTAVSAWALSRVKRKPFIFELGDLWPESIRAVGAMKKSFVLTLLEKMELFMYRQSTAVIALTEAFKVNLMQRGIPEGKIFVVRNGVDLSTHQLKAPNLELKEKLGLKNKFVIGYLGTLGMAHGLDRILDLAHLLQKKGNQNIAFLFVGSGADRQLLIQKAEELRLTNVVFVEAQPKNLIGDYWSILDIALAHVKNLETFKGVIPSKIFEAMAYGKPVLLIAPEGEAVEILRNAQCGVCLTDYDMDTLLASVEEVSRDPDWQRITAAKALEASKVYTRERQAQQYMAVLDQVLP